MNTIPPYELPTSNAAFADAENASPSVPIYAVRGPKDLKGTLEATGGFTPAQHTWIETSKFKGEAKARLLIPNADGDLGAVLFGLGANGGGEPCGPAELLIGDLPRQLPAHSFHLAGDWDNAELAAIAWGLGSYAFRAYKSSKLDASAQLVLAGDIDAQKVRRTTAAIWLGRDLINTPSNDMGPDELEVVARLLAGRHAADCSVTTGDDLLAQNFPLIHAVGRASSRAPRLIDIRWQNADGRSDAPRITIVGKGVCFDTGGLDIKPASGMLLMKKDMGGAASALALADMVMGAGLDVRLRVLIPAVENSISANAFRPSDIIKSRAGLTVEIGNTDAEGRLVLADALTLGDEDAPELMLTFATLTGAARVALGPDLPPCFVDDDGIAASIASAGMAVGDPVWRMPFWPGYDAMLNCDSADISNTGDTPFAGAVTAALFLKRFVKRARNYAHFDIYGWRPAPRPLGPRGGEPHAARAMFDVIAGIAQKG